MSIESVSVFVSYPTHRQTDRQTDRQNERSHYSASLMLAHLRKQIIAYWRTGAGLAAAERQPTAARQLSHVYCKVGLCTVGLAVFMHRVRDRESLRDWEWLYELRFRFVCRVPAYSDCELTDR